MGTVSYFFDTYAIYEVIQGNPKYAFYNDRVGFITTKLNLLELHHKALQVYGDKEADEYFDALAPFATEISDRTLKEASKLKKKINRRDVSYVDCVGYVMAAERGIKFLTGDKAFKDMENVEFVT